MNPANAASAMDSPTRTDVRYRRICGYHVFTSQHVKGLYVASKDADAALERLPQAIEALVKLNEGMERETLD